ncbi:MAG: HlyC/CorC family transporter [Clostridia bacterium]|nr:HlyC/CorC family transporter [Clostridia bacterium]
MDADPEPANLLIPVLVLLGLILINAFFAMSEMAIVSLNDSKIKKMAEDGHKKAKKVMKLTESASSFLSTIQIGVTLAGFLASASASRVFVDRFGGWLIELLGAFGKQHPVVVTTASLIVITLATSFVTLVLGELVPKRLAMQNPEKISFRVVGTLLVIRACLKPFVAILTATTNGIVRLFGVDPKHEPEEVTEEEILMMVDVGEEKGVIEESQKEMINNIFEFDDIAAENIMTHRTDILALEVTASLQDAAKIAIEEGFSRIPVYEDDLDNIVGVIYAKDLLPYVGNALPPEMTVAEKMRSVYYVPESKKCGDLFTEMNEKHIQMAIVVDEYGGTAGLVTLEDLIESILGNIQDEYDDEEEDIEQLSENVFTIDGVTDLDEVAERLDRDLPQGDYDTLAGMIMANLGYIPGEDETPTVEVNYTLFTVLSVEDRRIEKVRVEKLPIPQQDEQEEQ